MALDEGERPFRSFAIVILNEPTSKLVIPQPESLEALILT